MEVPYHPLKDEIADFLDQFIGKEIVIKASIEFGDVTIEGNDAVGNVLEEIIRNYLTEKFEDLVEGESNEPPDIFDETNDWNLEIKVFKSGNPPAFDVYSISKFFGSKDEDDWLSKSIHKTDYLIFEYEIDSDGKRTLKSIHHKKLHEILGYGGAHEISVQYSGNQYKNIRPSHQTTWGDNTKTPEKFIKHFKKFVGKLPTDLTGNKTNLKRRIQRLFDALKEELSREE